MSDRYSKGRRGSALCAREPAAFLDPVPAPRQSPGQVSGTAEASAGRAAVVGREGCCPLPPAPCGTEGAQNPENPHVPNPCTPALPVSPGKARKNYPNVQFEVADGWDTATIGGLAASPDNGAPGDWDCLFVDVGGLSGPDGFLEAVALLRQVPPSHLCSVRAQPTCALRCFAGRGGGGGAEEARDACLRPLIVLQRHVMPSRGI